MKRLWIIVLTAAMLPAAPRAEAQMVVELGAITQALMERTRIEQAIYYAQMVVQQVNAARNTYAQVQAMIRAEQRAFDNLRGITNVNSYGDFMAWYNRQLALEREADERYNSLGIQIGNSTYRIRDVRDIPNAMRTAYGAEYWESQFSPEQRREMWLNLGLTPSNYVYQSAWANREEELARRIMVRRGILHEDSQRAASRHAIMLEEAMMEETGEKAILQASLDLLVDINHLIRQGLLEDAGWREHQLAQQRLNSIPPNPPMLSEAWGQELFPSPLVGGRFIHFE